MSIKARLALINQNILSVLIKCKVKMTANRVVGDQCYIEPLNTKSILRGLVDDAVFSMGHQKVLIPGQGSTAEIIFLGRGHQKI